LISLKKRTFKSFQLTILIAVLAVEMDINVYVTVLIMKFDLFVRLIHFSKMYFRQIIPLILIFLGLTTYQTSPPVTTNIISTMSTLTTILTSNIPSNCNTSTYILLFNGTCALKTDVQV